MPEKKTLLGTFFEQVSQAFAVKGMNDIETSAKKHRTEATTQKRQNLVEEELEAISEALDQDNSLNKESTYTTRDSTTRGL